MERWRDFERLAEQIFCELNPYATVTRDEHIVGRDSGISRQIDVTIRWTESGRDYLTIVQARDKTKPADVNTIGEFRSVIDDVGADRGILVCRGGFAKTIHMYAQRSRISLLKLHDAQSMHWAQELTIPLIWIEFKPHVMVGATAYFEVGDYFSTDDPLGLPMTVDDGHTRVNPISTFERHWNSGQAHRLLDMTHHVTSDRPLQAIVHDVYDQVQLRPGNLDISYTVEKQAWFGEFKPSECRGVVDCLDQETFTASYLPLDQVPLTRDERWAGIDDPEETASSLRGTFITKEVSVEISFGGIGELTATYLGPEQ